MKTYSSTQLKNEMSTVYNSVLQDGQAKITHRDRPTMVLITLNKLEKALTKDAYREVLKEEVIIKF